MLFVGDINNRGLSDALGKSLGADVIYPDKHIFDDGEQRIRIEQSVLDADVYLLKSTSDPVDSNTLELLFTVDALKRSGAKRITAIIPYLGYARADHIFREGEAVALEVIIRALESTGLDEVIIIDPHTVKISEMFSVDVRLESALSVFADKINELELSPEKLSIVSPDMGGIRRVKQLAELLPGSVHAAINKDRDLATGKLSGSRLGEGEIREICVVTDDIISTGGTMVNAVDTCLSEGAKKVYMFATQPVFANDAHKKLADCKAEKIFITDAIPVPEEKMFPNLEILSLAPHIAKILGRS